MISSYVSARTTTTPAGTQKRRDALLPDDKTREEMRKAVEKVALAATSIVKMKKRAASMRPSSRKMRERMRLELEQTVWPSEASQPCSPTRQILKIKAQRKRRELGREVSKEDWERYER